jgi:outer membrane immunogenic protein
MRMYRLAFVFAAGAAMLAPLSQAASAADMGTGGSLKDTPYVAVPSWQGFYFGGHAGGVWGDSKVHDKFDYVGDPILTTSPSGSGFIGGAQAGYNIQRGHIVFGPEVDIGYLGLSLHGADAYTPKASDSCTAQYGPTDTETYSGARNAMCAVSGKYSSSTDLYGDLTARLGYATDRTLFYVKGGAAIVDADFKTHYDGANCLTYGECTPKGNTKVGYSTFDFSHSDTLLGWTVGAGAEYALNSSWSLKAEYQHFDFGKASYSSSGCYAIGPNSGSSTGGTCPASGSQYSGHYTSTISNGKTDVSITADAVKVGINYHVGGEGGLK